MIQRLGKYAIVEKLGEGSMGAVYKAYDTVLDRLVAIKTMAEGVEWEPEMKLRFYREAKLAAGLHHPNIVVIHDLGEDGNITYIVMELLEGKDLKSIIQSKDPLMLEQKLSIMAQAADGLNHAHNSGIVHRDIKPSNIFVSSSGNVKILDFGIARVPTSDLTRSGVRLGTPVYMAPEQIRDQACDQQTDIFSAGIVFYELIAYIHPFRDKNIVKTLDNILLQNPRSLMDQFPDAPPGLSAIIENCLAKDLQKRTKNMGDVGLACRNLLDDLNATSRRMARELEELLPRLRQASDSPDSTSRIKDLVRDARQLLNGATKPDYLSLKALRAAVEADSAALKPLSLSPDSEARVPSPEPQPFSREEGEKAKVVGLRLLSEKKFREALAALRQASALLGEDASVRSAIEAASKAIRAQEIQAEVDEGIAKASQLIMDEDFGKARAQVEILLKLSPENAEASELLSKINRLDLERQRKNQIADLLARARGALNRNEFTVASLAAREIVQMEPQNAEATGLLRQIDEAKDQQYRREVVAGLLLKAEIALNQQDFKQATAFVDEVLRVESQNAEAKAFLGRILNIEAEKRKQDEVSTLLLLGQEALKQRKLTEAADKTRLVLELDHRNKEAQGLLKLIGQAQDIQKQEKIAGLLAKSQQSLSRRESVEATNAAKEVLNLDPRNRKAKSLLKAASRENQRRLKEQAREIGHRAKGEPGSGIEATKAVLKQDDTLVLHRSKWAVLLTLRAPLRIGLAVTVVLTAALIAIFLMGRSCGRVPQPDPLSSAQESLDRKDFVRAKELAKELAERGDARAKTIVEQAEKGQTALWIDGQLSQAQDYRTQGKLEESKVLLEKILVHNPQDERVQRALSEVESALQEVSDRERLEKEIQDLMVNARALIRDNRLDEARVALDRILKASPDLAEAKTLDSRWKKKKKELEERLAANAIEEKYQQQLAAANSEYEQANLLFMHGSYETAQSMLESLVKKENLQYPQTQELLEKTQDLLKKTREAQRYLTIFIPAGQRAKFGEALDALKRLIAINPADPHAGSLQEVTKRKEKARAYLTIFPRHAIGQAILLLDGNAIGENGRVTKQPISIDKHKIVAKTQQGERTYTTTEYLADGENIELVYDDTWLRNATQEDKVASPPEPKEETPQKFSVVHPHKIGFIGTGNCKGILTISSTVVRYTPTSGNHGRSWEIQAIASVAIEGEKTLVIKTKDNKSEKYTAHDAKNAKAILEYWEKVQRSGK